MSAVVTFELPRRDDVLALPHEAVVAEQNPPVCYVVAGDHLERREVQFGQSTTDLIEITDGLAEGEEVVLDPPGRTGRPRSLAGFDSVPLPKDAFKRAPVPVSKGARQSRGGAGGGDWGDGGGAPGGQWRKGGGAPGGEWRKGGGGPGGPNRKFRKKAAEDE
jgi:hypothetical protein